MISDVLFSTLLVVGVVWLYLMRHGVWPYDCTIPCQKPSAPTPARGKGSKEPKPFLGLTAKPHCAACEQSMASPQPPPPVPPAPLLLPKRRPRQVDTARHFCPHATCAYRGWVGLGNLRANGHPNGGPWRQFHCTGCGGYVLETHGTLLYGKRVPVELIVRVIACIAEGLGIRGTARVFEVDPNTVLQWLVEVADQLQAFSRYFLGNVYVRQVQLDELYAVLSAVKDGTVSESEAIERLDRSLSWVWVAMDPESKLLLTVDVGERTLATAQWMVHQVAQMLAPGCVPLFLTDGFKAYLTALLTHFGHWVAPVHRQTKPRWMPLPQLLYAQVVKTVHRQRLVRVYHRVVFGTLESVQQVLTAHGWQINTAFVERVVVYLQSADKYCKLLPSRLRGEN
jgi:hypothetical protein